MIQGPQVTVSPIHTGAWECGELVEITEPIPVEEWLDLITGPDAELYKFPHETLIDHSRYEGETVDRYYGGVVIGVNSDHGNYLLAIPPEVVPLLMGLLPDQDFRQLVRETPSLRGSPWDPDKRS
jgi:hypothetical protein